MQGGNLMTLVKNFTIFIIQDNSFNSTFTVDNHRKTIKKKTYVPNSIGREGVSNLGQCLKFYCFFLEGIP